MRAVREHSGGEELGRGQRHELPGRETDAAGLTCSDQSPRPHTLLTGAVRRPTLKTQTS